MQVKFHDMGTSESGIGRKTAKLPESDQAVANTELGDLADFDKAAADIGYAKLLAQLPSEIDHTEAQVRQIDTLVELVESIAADIRRLAAS